MAYQIQDSDRCLVFIKILSYEFFIFALEDDFYLSQEHLGFEPILEIMDIDLTLLNFDTVENFLTINQKFIQSNAHLWQDFYYLFEQQASYWDYIDCHLIPIGKVRFTHHLESITFKGA